MEKWLIGNPNSVLLMELENFLILGDMENMMSCLPFSGAHRLPTADQVLKLYFVFRGLEKYQRTENSYS